MHNNAGVLNLLLLHAASDSSVFPIVGGSVDKEKEIGIMFQLLTNLASSQMWKVLINLVKRTEHGKVLINMHVS